MIEELNAARELCERAGEVLLDHYSRAPSIEWKGPDDPVTSADREASRLIVREIAARFPADGILCEEERDDGSRLEKTRVWIIDPMDGTKEFIEHRDEFAVMIGLAVDSVPVVGAVYQPLRRKLYYAAQNRGAFLQTGSGTQPLRVSADTDADLLVAAVSRSHDSPRGRLIRERLQVAKVIRSGSCGLKVGLVCEGVAHLYTSLGPGTKQWDTCAPEAILREAGGRMSSTRNIPLAYNAPDLKNRHGLVATNGAIHDKVIEAVRHVLQSTGPIPG